MWSVLVSIWFCWWSSFLLNWSLSSLPSFSQTRSVSLSLSLSLSACIWLFVCQSDGPLSYYTVNRKFAPQNIFILGTSINDVTQFQGEIDSPPLSVTFGQNLGPPTEITSQAYNLPPPLKRQRLLPAETSLTSASYISCERDTARICYCVPCCDQCSSAAGGVRTTLSRKPAARGSCGRMMGQTDERTRSCHRLCSICVYSAKLAVTSVPCVTSQHFTLPYPLRHTSSHQPGPPPLRVWRHLWTSPLP